ncbi:MAG TPA: SRPBCC family protein [Solirubrobacteraceae bacterium]|nr:SRPBCC family protein [Solirubrobacteraceae bacterium]
MTPIVATVEIARPPEDVFAYATDPSKFSVWQKGVVSAGIEGGHEPAVGAKCTARYPRVV